jgi:hypothetical protein
MSPKGTCSAASRTPCDLFCLWHRRAGRPCGAARLAVSDFFRGELGPAYNSSSPRQWIERRRACAFAAFGAFAASPQSPSFSTYGPTSNQPVAGIGVSSSELCRVQNCRSLGELGGIGAECRDFLEHLGTGAVTPPVVRSVMLHTNAGGGTNSRSCVPETKLCSSVLRNGRATNQGL